MRRTAVADGTEAGAMDWVALDEEIKGRLRGWVEDEDDVSDLAQDCLTKVWLKGNTFSGQSKFSSWLHSIVRNEFLSWVRKRKVHERVGRQWLAEHTRPSRRDLAETTTDRLAVAKLMSRLGALDRCILELRYVDDRTSMDIGRELDLAPSSVRCRMTRVRGDFAALEA